MDYCLEAKFRRMRKVLNLERPDCLPLTRNCATVQYRQGFYTKRDPDEKAKVRVRPGEVYTSADGKRAYTRDGGLWSIGDKELYRDGEDVLNANLERFQPETVSAEMLEEMARLRDEMMQTGYPTPWHYGTLITRATIEFGWEPFLTAAALDEVRFGEILSRFGEASVAVASGWAQTEGIELVVIHDDIAATRGPILSPAWLRRNAFPWYEKIFDAIHAHGRKVLFISDGNYLPLLADFLALRPDGLHIESTSMDPETFMRKAGEDKFFLLKSNTRNIDHGTPEEVKRELSNLGELHRAFPGIYMYRGGSRLPECVEAFDRYYSEYLVYCEGRLK